MTGLPDVMDAESQHTELKKLLLKGKEQGFLMYTELNDHLPDDIYDTDQFEVVVNMINDMGIEVMDQPPDSDTLLRQAEPPDEAVVEAVFGRSGLAFGRWWIDTSCFQCCQWKDEDQGRAQ